MADDPDVEARRRYDAFHRRSLEDPDAFWREAAQLIDWSTPPDRVFEQPEPPSFRWFPGGHTNLAYNALDRHVAAGRGDQTALIAIDERGGRADADLRASCSPQVERTAAALRGLGIGRGDRLTIYMPTCAEAIVADARDRPHRGDPLGRLRGIRVTARWATGSGRAARGSSSPPT